MRETDPYEHLAHLVAQAQTGDRNAFEEAYRLTAQAQFFSIAAKTNAEVAPDLLQEVYLTVWKNIAKIRPRSFVGYLNTVTHNVCLRHYERTSRPREIPAPADDLEAAERDEKHEARAEHTADPAIITNTRDEQALLARALREVLDDREREAVLLRFYQEMRIDDIAAAMELSPSTVKRTLRRALGKLRASLGDLPRGGAFIVLLADAVEEPLATGVAPRPRPARLRPIDGAVRAAAAVSALVVVGCLGAAFTMERPAFGPSEVIEETPVPAADAVEPAAPADTAGPRLTAMTTEHGATVVTLADESGIGDVRLTDENGTVHQPVAMEASEGAEGGADGMAGGATDGGTDDESETTSGLGAAESGVRDAGAEGSGIICRFDVPSGTYTLTATDLCGNIAEGTVTISLPPAEPTSLSDL